jgi:predicted transposase YbfD/YdcC
VTTKWVNVEPIGSYFRPLCDPRHTRNREHLLIGCVVVAACAVARGRDGPAAIHRRAANRKGWLGGFLALPNGVPSRDRIRRLLMASKPDAFRECFQDWIAHATQGDEDAAARSIAIDGKTCRRSRGAARGLGPPRAVGAWASGEGIALGRAATEARPNEITAIPSLLQRIELADAVVTIDATGRRKQAAAAVAEGKGDFVLAAKDNRPSLREAAEGYLMEQLGYDFEGLRHRHHEASEAGHGRADGRAYHLGAAPGDFAPKSWRPWVKAIGYAARVSVDGRGHETSEVRFRVLSRHLSGKRLSEAARGHWGIESMHWVLGVTSREDDSRTRERALGNDLSWLRRLAVTLLKRHPIKDSLKGKMIRCTLNTDFLTEVLTLQ